MTLTAATSSLKILITGANGTVARYIIKGLTQHSSTSAAFNIVGLVRSAQYIEDNTWLADIDTRVSNYQNDEAMLVAIAEADVIIHTAAVTRSADTQVLKNANEAVTQRLVTLAEQAQVKRFIYLSSDLAENPVGAYGRSKAACEQIVAESDLPDWVNLRLAPFIGSNTNNENSTFAKFLCALSEQQRLWLPAAGHFAVAPLAADDLCRLLIQVINTPSPIKSTYTVTGSVTTLRAFLDKAASKLNTTANIGHVPMPLIMTARQMLALIPFIKHPMLESLAALKQPPAPSASALKHDFDFAPSSVDALLSSVIDAN